MTKAKAKKKTPLNNVVRNFILTAVLSHRFSAAQKELTDRPKQLAQDFYDTVLTKDEQAQIEAAPKGWFRQTREVYIHVDGKTFSTRFAETKLQPYDWAKTEFSSSSALGKKIMKYWADKDKLAEERFKAESATQATLKSFRYLEDLVEAWPEVKRFVPDGITKKQQMTAALAIPPKDLNAMLRLP